MPSEAQTQKLSYCSKNLEKLEELYIRVYAWNIMKKISSIFSLSGYFQIIFLVALLFITLSGCHSKTQQDINSSQIVLRPQTKEEAFEFLLHVLQKMPFFKEKGYSVALPDNSFFLEPEKQSDIFKNRDKYFSLFQRDVYSEDDFKVGLSVLKKKMDDYDRVIKKLNVLNKKWGFKTFPQYEVVLTLYGPGGSYDPDSGQVILLTRPDGTFKEPNPFETIIHELVHMGIEENIVRKYNLSHWEKERLVDLICSLYLNDELPSYRFGKKGDTTIDSFVTKDKITEALPVAIEEFVNAHPRITENNN